MARQCLLCKREIFESMGSVIARDILGKSTERVREICAKCVGRLVYADDKIIVDVENLE